MKSTRSGIMGQERISPVQQLTTKEINACIEKIGLKETSEYDRYVAAYHLLYPHLVDTENYKHYITLREDEIFHKKKSEDPIVNKLKVVELSFEDKCDIILMEMENENYTSLGNLTPKVAKEIIRQIMQYWDSIDQMKKESPEYKKIYNRVEPFSRRASKKKSTKGIDKQINNLELLTEFEGITAKPTSTLFEEGYKGYVFYHIKYKRIIFYENESKLPIWKGTKTLIGNTTMMSAKFKDMKGAISSRSKEKILMRLPKKKLLESERLRISEYCILLKAIKR